MKCPICDGKGKVLDYVAERNCHGEWETVLREIPCDICQRKPMTNEEWLRTCSTEELAEFIRKQRDDWSDGWYSDWHNTEEIIEWLKEKHNG